MKKSTEQQIAALFVQAMRTALALIDDKAAPKAASAKTAKGIYAHQSKYNPWRAYERDGSKTIYLGAFPSIAKAKAAQKAFRHGRPIVSGTKAPAFRLAKAA